MSYLIALIIVVVPLIWEAWATFWLWSWFAVPAGAHPVTVAGAIGISILVSLMTWQYIPNRNQLAVVWHNLVNTTTYVIIGFLIHHFLM